MLPLTRQDTRPSILSWWSDSNPGLQGPTINLHAVAKPLLKVMYHRQALGIIKRSRGAPLSSETLSIFSSYLPLSYVSSSTKVAILTELLERADLQRDDALAIVHSADDHLPTEINAWHIEVPNTTFDPEREQRRLQLSNIKVVLFGQRESGKTTLLKNLRLYLAPDAFQAEAGAWRSVIRLNLVRSINFVLSKLEIPSSQPSPSDSASSSELRRLSINLAPLRHVEETLINLIGGSSPLDENSQAGQYHSAKVSEISVRAGAGWTAFRRGFTSGSDREEHADELQASRILSACAGDIMTLWAAPEVQQILKAFLDQVQRICDENYTPKPDDILRARVHTVGPEEYFIPMKNHKNPRLQSWTVYDVDDSTMRRAGTWVQFFDEVEAIVFLVPISTFDEVLEENPEVNRLEDSLNRWKALCSNKLLASVHFILFLNKADILNSKLQSGVQFNSYLRSYGNRPNKLNEVIRYLKRHFAAIHRENSPRARLLYQYIASAIDARATATITSNINDIRIRKALKIKSFPLKGPTS
ncbi:putative G protein alpha chain [Mycena venus]|uniref:Putative G protein alpha chain n=1 Tax=Mycena venus TaxID=2733690 RepID=A0A8H7DAE3_9AGAR|nr:putative G protein alpha chain [Mycena venus]